MMRRRYFSTSSFKESLCCRFTLVELMVAMTILLIMVGMMLYILASGERNWRYMQLKARMYENSRVVFDLIERDLRSIVTQDFPPKKGIGFYLFNHNATDSTQARIICLVSTQDPNDNSLSKLCEVTWSVHRDGSDPQNAYVLRRQVVSQRYEDWNFVGAPPNWYLNNKISSPDFETVLYGVFDLIIQIEDLSGPVPIGSVSFSRPVKATISLSLVDEKVIGDPRPEVITSSLRTFSKVIYFSNLHTK